MRSRRRALLIALLVPTLPLAMATGGCSSSAPPGAAVETDGAPADAATADGPATGPDADPIDASSADAAEADARDAAGESSVDAGADALVCRSTVEKLCQGACVALNLPETGCSAATCAPCSLAHATATCSASACAVARCADGYGDCNGTAADGCEVDTATSLAHCGRCGQLCRTTCSGGICADPVSTGRLPDSYDRLCTSGTALGACPTPTQALYGQDGSFVANTPAYTVIQGTVYDPVSGLMWEQALAPGPFTRDEAKARCDALNARSFAGYADWRFPTAYEALTLVDSGRNGLPPTIFSGQQQNSGIWTAADQGGDATLAFLLGSNWNNMIVSPKVTSLPASSLCVRGAAQPPSSAVSKSGNLVKDSRTGLTWQRAMAPSTYTWSQALDYCNTLTVDGAGGFRLPSYKELWSIVDTTRQHPAVDTALFPGTPDGSMWTSSPLTIKPASAHVVEMGTGRAYYFDQAQSTLLPIRCVSGG